VNAAAGDCDADERLPAGSAVHVVRRAMSANRDPVALQTDKEACVAHRSVPSADVERPRARLGGRGARRSLRRDTGQAPQHPPTSPPPLPPAATDIDTAVSLQQSPLLRLLSYYSYY